HVLVTTLSERFHTRVRHRISSNGDDRYTHVGLLSNLLSGDDAIENRQIEIHEDQVEVFTGCYIDRFLAVACFQYAVAKSFKTLFEQYASVVVVFHDHDCACGVFVRHLFTPGPGGSNSTSSTTDYTGTFLR